MRHPPPRLGSTLLLGLALLAACSEETAQPEPRPVDAAPLVEDQHITVDQALPEVDAAPIEPDAAPIEPDAALIEPDVFVPELDAAPLIDALPAPPMLHEIQTRLGSPSTRAGQPNQITCEALDGEGRFMEGITTRVEIRPATGWAEGEEEGAYVGLTAGRYQVVCAAPEDGLRAAPVEWLVRPGDVAAIYATVEPPIVVAGEAATARCEAFDAAGNALVGAAITQSLSPVSEGAALVEGRVEATRAGRYLLTCALDGLEGSAPLDVRPGAPDRLIAALSPVARVYELGAIITYDARVLDAFGNEISGAPLVWSSTPPMPAFGERRYRPDAEGIFTVEVAVEGTALRASEEIIIDAGGPDIACISPEDGAMIGRGPLTLEGRVSDAVGVNALRVDGQRVPIQEGGRFTADITPEWGLNVHLIEAEDSVGHVNSTLCAYFAADDYLNEDATLDDAILVQMSQEAIDDGAPNEPITSLGDLLRRIVDSEEMLTVLDESLRAQNPILPTTCQQSLPLIGCVFYLGAEYQGLSLNGPNSLSAQLVEGGVRATATFRDLSLDVRLRGTLSNTGTLYVSHMTLDMTFDVGLRRGQIDVRVRSVEPIEIGDISSDFEGAITGTLLDLVFWAFEDLIRDEVANTMQGFVEGEIDALLSGLFASVDLSSLGASFPIPAIAGLPETRLSMEVGLSTLNATPQRLQMGIASHVNGPLRQGAPAVGVPMPPAPALMEIEMSTNMAGGVYLGLINQILFRLWRASLFTFDDAGALLGDLPEGTEISFHLLTPPAAIGAGGADVRLFLGPAVVRFRYPGLFDEALDLRLAAEARAGVRVDGGLLRFEDIEITQLQIALDAMDMTPEQRDALSDLFRRILQAIIDSYLNGLLPTFPVPDFALPESLESLGVPPGTRLGLRDPSLESTPAHLLLHGTFRE
ncbi:hypothetical protein KKF91_07055 [Myxococcota bacterium]|nr:hypothetical protein [Myxococcota bacterium]MBU1430310.1 hypothetical protein [Myxococcota bacterium]MBU1900520.1 hypothetical protein [Myxococcota bacterium]